VRKLRVRRRQNRTGKTVTLNTTH